VSQHALPNTSGQRRMSGACRSRARARARHVSLQDKYIEMRRSKKRNTKKRSISTTRKSKEIDIYRTKTACARTRIGGRTVWAA